MKQKIILSLAALSLPLSVAAARPAKAPVAEGSVESRAIGVEASIAFPSFGTIRDFEADGNSGLWIEDRHRNWYYATVVGPCTNLGFAHKIGIDTRGTSRLDRFGAVIVEGERCALSSFVTAEKPLPRKERFKRLKAANEAKDAAAE